MLFDSSACLFVATRVSVFTCRFTNFNFGIGLSAYFSSRHLGSVSLLARRLCELILKEKATPKDSKLRGARM